MGHKIIDNAVLTTTQSFILFRKAPVFQWFQSAQELAASIGINPSMPRITAYMRHRSNIPGDDEETYFRRNITIPCINEVCLCEGLLFSLIYKHYN